MKKFNKVLALGMAGSMALSMAACGGSSSSAASTSTSVTLSDAQAKLMQPGSSDINLERVEALKLAIRNGELKMDTGKIADALINEAQQDLQSN